MSEWKDFELKELTTKIGSGATPRGGQEAYKTEGISLIRSQNILDFSFSYSGLAFIDEEQANRLKNVIIEEDDVLINITGDSVARVAKVPNEVLPARVNQHVSILRTDKEKLAPDYLLYYLLNPVLKKHLLRIASDGATRNALTKTDLEDLIIVAPENVNEQKEIANLLSIYDKKITLLRQQNKDLEELAQTLFKRWFMEFEFPNEDGESYKSSGGKMVESELGEIPEGWQVGIITELFEVKDGTHDSPKKQVVGKKLITSKHLSRFSLNDKDAYFISEEDYHNINKRSLVEQFDILYSMIGTIGLTYFEQNATIDYAIKNVALFKTSQNKKWAIFTYLWLTSFLGKHFITANKSGSTQEYVSLTSLRNLEICIPSDSVIIKFDNVLSSIFRNISNNTNEIQTLTQLRDTLLPKLMSGELSIKM